VGTEVSMQSKRRCLKLSCSFRGHALVALSACVTAPLLPAGDLFAASVASRLGVLEADDGVAFEYAERRCGGCGKPVSGRRKRSR
jgi:hypothetical protein